MKWCDILQDLIGHFEEFHAINKNRILFKPIINLVNLIIFNSSRPSDTYMLW